MRTSTASRKIPLLDLAPSYLPIRDEILAEVTRVIDSQMFILGEDVKRLEEEVGAYCHAKHAIGCASGSDALYLALLAIDIQPGDRVLTTPFSFFATAGAISRCGATPVFVDIDPVTYNLDPDRLEEAFQAHSGIKAIIPVHLYGGCADLDPILELARRRNCFVIEDGAQSIGSEYKGRRAQSLGDIGCLSFFPSKNLGAFGDGGLMTTNSEELGYKLAALRVHGSAKKYFHDWIGINSRLDALQAAVLRVKLRYLDSWTEARRQNAALYRRFLPSESEYFSLPQEAPHQTRHIYNQFVIRSRQRDKLKQYLQENGVVTEIYYPLPLHMQVCYRSLGYRAGDFPIAETAAEQVLALPIYPGLTQEDIEYVAGLLHSFAG